MIRSLSTFLKTKFYAHMQCEQYMWHRKTNNSARRTNYWQFASEIGRNNSNERSKLAAAGFLNW
jgi:hypothetical protein